MNSHLNYFPLVPGFLSLLAAALAILAVLIHFGVLRFAYSRLGLRPGTVLLLLLASLLGSYINVPIVHFGDRTVVVDREVYDFGYRFAVPAVVDWPGTIIAINIGGAVIPIMLSVYLLAKNMLWGAGLIAIAGVTAVCHMVAYPVPGVGIAMPVIVPPLATAFIAVIVSWRNAAPLAYISGSLGTLIGADLLNLPSIDRLGTPMASIGGAGTFDGVFLTGIVAVVLASLMRGPGDLEPEGEET